MQKVDFKTTEVHLDARLNGFEMHKLGSNMFNVSQNLQKHKKIF